MTDDEHAANLENIVETLLAERDTDKALIAVYSDAYKEASHEVSVNWEAATALAEENTELKQRIAELEEREKRVIKLANDSGELCDRVMDALEARTLTVKLPDSDDYLNKYDDRISDMAAYENAVRRAITAAGIKLDVGE